jgi:hypothetical protein
MKIKWTTARLVLVTVAVMATRAGSVDKKSAPHFQRSAFV